MWRTFLRSRPSAPVFEINNMAIFSPCLLSTPLKIATILDRSSIETSPEIIAYFLPYDLFSDPPLISVSFLVPSFLVPSLISNESASSFNFKFF